MIGRRFIQVTGRGGVGKTTLIERIVEANHHRALVLVRGEVDDTLWEPVEQDENDDQELRRYRRAGASSVVRYRHPPGRGDTEDFYETELMADYSEAVIVEADGWCDLPCDLGVYVTAPPSPALLERVEVDGTATHEAHLAKLERWLEEPDGLREYMATMLGVSVDVLPPLTERLRAEDRDALTATLKAARARDVPPLELRWAITPTYEGIERAQVVVINVRREQADRDAERLLADVRRLRKDEKIFEDVIGWRGNRVPITARIADLSSSTSHMVRTIVQRVARVFPS